MNEWSQSQREELMRGGELQGLLCPMAVQATTRMTVTTTASSELHTDRCAWHQISLPPPRHVCLPRIASPGPRPLKQCLVFCRDPHETSFVPLPYPLPQMQCLARQRTSCGEQKPEQRTGPLCLVSGDEVSQGLGPPKHVFAPSLTRLSPGALWSLTSHLHIT